MCENTIELKNIYSMSGMKFFIPDYQRGYRWSASEAKQMLNDLKNSANERKKRANFIAFNPLWLRKSAGQRLKMDKQ